MEHVKAVVRTSDGIAPQQMLSDTTAGNHIKRIRAVLYLCADGTSDQPPSQQMRDNYAARLNWTIVEQRHEIEDRLPMRQRTMLGQAIEVMTSGQADLLLTTASALAGLTDDDSAALQRAITSAGGFIHEVERQP